MNLNRAVHHRRWPLLRSGLAGVCLVCVMAFAAVAAEPMILTSVTKQFIIRGQPQTSAFANNPSSELVYIHPALLVVTCERVKHALARELGWGEQWRGTIFVNVHPLRFDNEQPEIHPFRSPEGWRFRLDLPDELNRTRLIESLVEVLLIEFADRTAQESSAELPPWLVEGLTAHLMASSLIDVAYQPSALNVSHRANTDPVAKIREQVQTGGAMSIDQLNWADFDSDDAACAENYHRSAHLLVRELLRLRGGADCWCATLAMLPENLNWQTAFLRGFESHFRRMVDLEKWWALSVIKLKTTETSVHWSASEAKQKIEDILYTSMQVQIAGEESPHIEPVALQTVIADWNYQQQLPLLQTKLSQLQLARVRLTPEMTSLVDGYRNTILKYLQTRAHPGRLFRERNVRAAVAQALEEITTLDEQRAKAPIKALTTESVGKAFDAVREAERLLAETE